MKIKVYYAYSSYPDSRTNATNIITLDTTTKSHSVLIKMIKAKFPHQHNIQIRDTEP